MHPSNGLQGSIGPTEELKDTAQCGKYDSVVGNGLSAAGRQCDDASSCAVTEIVTCTRKR